MAGRSENLAQMRIAVSPLADILLHACDRGPDKEALVFPTGRKSYAAVTRSVLLRARGLIGLGIQPGDHVGILLPSGVEFAETLFAVAMVGGVSVLMNARFRAPEVCPSTTRRRASRRRRASCAGEVPPTRPPRLAQRRALARCRSVQ